MSAKWRRVKIGNEHDDQKWLVLEGYVDGCPPVTKRVTISVAALVTDPGLLEASRSKLLADVNEYFANYQLLQLLPEAQ